MDGHRSRLSTLSRMLSLGHGIWVLLKLVPYLQGKLSPVLGYPYGWDIDRYTLDIFPPSDFRTNAHLSHYPTHPRARFAHNYRNRPPCITFSTQIVGPLATRPGHHFPIHQSLLLCTTRLRQLQTQVASLMITPTSLYLSNYLFLGSKGLVVGN